MGAMDDFMAIGLLLVVVGGGYFLVTSLSSQQPSPMTMQMPKQTMKKGKQGGAGSGSGRQVMTTTTVPSGSAASTGNCGALVNRSTGKTATGGSGKNQQIHYASTGMAATSHRVDIMGWTAKNYEATVYLTWPSAPCGKDHLTIKFWGPSHTDSTCCWCMTTLGGAGDVSFGGEGPHPNTSSVQARGTNVGNIHGKKVGFKGMIWQTGSSIHQEAWVDLGAGWKRVGVNNRATCGFNKTITSPVSSQDVEFRFDCGSVVYDCTTVTEIVAPTGAAAGAGYYSANAVTETQDISQPILRPSPTDYQRIVRVQKRHGMTKPILAVEPPPILKHNYSANVVDYERSCD